jgi:hypothetical protein
MQLEMMHSLKHYTDVAGDNHKSLLPYYLSTTNGADKASLSLGNVCVCGGGGSSACFDGRGTVDVNSILTNTAEE